jgi:hypothetical protein
MPDLPVSHDFVYVHTDIPAGMTIREWRAQRVADRAGAHRAAQAGRRRFSPQRWVAIAVDVWPRLRRQTHRAPVREVRA